MLGMLIRSWAQIQLPQNCSVSFLVVENDTEPRSATVVQNANEMMAETPLRHVLEPQLGIAYARNRAAREAICQAADLLLFIDDDEEPAEDWLVRIVSAYRYSGALLLGGPVRARPPLQVLTPLEAKIYANVADYYWQREKQMHAAVVRNGRPVRIATNNWLADLSLFTKYGLWFDDTLGFSGGEDSDFSTKVHDMGLPMLWVDDAIVYETISPDRLSFSYQFRRSRDQSNTHARRKSTARRRLALIALLSLVPKSAVLVRQCVLLVITRGRNIADVARTLGWMAGRLAFVRGDRPSSYADTTGY